MALCFHDITAGSGMISSLFLAGLAGGFTHCTAMCGPFVMAQIRPSDPSAPFLQKLKGAALIPYHLGRTTTYVGLAVLFSIFLNAIIQPSQIRTILNFIILFTAALVFLSNAIPALGAVFPFLTRMSLPLPVKAIQRFSAPLLRSPSITQQYLLGTLLGFMPCGMVLAALIAAGSLSHPVQSAIAMAAFAAGTAPALILSAMGGNFLLGRFPQSLSIFRLSMMALSTGFLLLTLSRMIFLT